MRLEKAALATKPQRQRRGDACGASSTSTVPPQPQPLSIAKQTVYHCLARNGETRLESLESSRMLSKTHSTYIKNLPFPHILSKLAHAWSLSLSMLKSASMVCAACHFDTVEQWTEYRRSALSRRRPVPCESQRSLWSASPSPTSKKATEMDDGWVV